MGLKAGEGRRRLAKAGEGRRRLAKAGEGPDCHFCLVFSYGYGFSRSDCPSLLPAFEFAQNPSVVQICDQNLRQLHTFEDPNRQNARVEPISK